MKKTYFFLQTLAVLCLAFTVGCSDDNDFSGGKKMTMTTTKESGEIVIYMTGTGDATINWGDRSSETYTLSELYLICQRYNFENNSQLTLMTRASWPCCI